ncbi:MAG: aldo/keto reductase [Christensenellales bacterium]|jgi:diketogulonate reductase-like aldo/keto reductase
MKQVPMARLPNGVEMPMVGLGTFRSAGSELREAVVTAIKTGYTSVDTAWVYENEQDVAAGINAAKASREDILITSKLWNDLQGYDSTMKAFDESLRLLNTDYIDLYLIHWPGKEKFVDTWKAFEKLYKDERVRAVGVSNFMPHHLDVLLDSCEIVPMVNQIEAHAYFMDYDTIEYCQRYSILVEAWSPLGYGSGLLKEKALKDAGKAHGKTPAQVALRFLIQNGIRVLPKSVHADRQKQNFEIFDFALTEKEMDAIRSLNTKRRLGPNPDVFFIWDRD